MASLLNLLEDPENRKVNNCPKSDIVPHRLLLKEDCQTNVKYCDHSEKSTKIMKKEFGTYFYIECINITMYAHSLVYF